MKLDKELYTKHAKRLQAILNEKSTFAQYIARPDFSKVIEVSLNTLAAAEKKLTNVELPAKLSAKSLTKEFNKLGKNTFKLDEKFKYEDDGDLIDNINYLSTYCKNIYKVNIDELVEGKQVTAASPTIDLKSKTEVDEIPEAMGPGMAFGGAAAYDNPLVMGKAYAKMKEQVSSGALYTYTSKPRAVIFAKWGSLITIAIAAILLIVMSVFAFMCSSLVIKGYKSDGTVGQGTLGFNATGSGIMYVLVAAFAAYPIYQTLKGLLSKNDNLKYYFNWPWALIFIIMLLLFVMPDMRQTWTPWFLEVVSTQTPKYINAHNSWKLMYIITLSFGGVCIVPMVLGAVFNPKQNKELIEKTLKQYADEVVASYGWPTPPTPGADVQKPVDVKKSEPKKSDDKPSKSKK